MFGLDLLSVGILHLAALDTKPSVDRLQCNQKKSIFIDVLTEKSPVKFDFSKKTAELNHIGRGAYSPYGEGHSNSEFKGLTVGRQFSTHDVKFYVEEYNDKLACLHIQKIKVVMHYMPSIYISTKFKKGTPIFDKILEHEKEHVKISQRMIDKYKVILKEKLKNNLQSGLIAGPFSMDRIKQEQKNLEGRVTQIINKVKRAMHQEAKTHHNLFDDAELGKSIEYNQGIARKLEEIFKINN